MQISGANQKFYINNLKESRFVINSSVSYFIFTLLYVLFTDSLWSYTWENRTLYYATNIAVAIFAVIAFVIIIINAKDIDVKKIIAPIVLILGLIINMTVNGSISFGYIQKLSYPLIGLMLCMLLDFNKLSKAFVKVMVFLAIWSLMLWVLAQFKLDKYLPTIKNLSGLEFRHTIFAFMPVNRDYLIRNWGAFWEPGAFQAYLSLALIFDLFYLKNRKPFNFIILSITILSTFSTTGYLCLGLILLVYLFAGDKQCKLNKMLVFIMIILGSFIIFSSEKIINMVFKKLFFDDINQSSSFGARYYSIVGNIAIMFDEGLIVGTGIANYSTIYKGVVNNMGYFLDMSNTNTIFIDLARFGWLVGGVNVYLAYKFSKKLGDNIVQKIGIMASIILLLFMESFTYSLFWMSIAYLSFDVLGKEKKNENTVFVQ